MATREEQDADPVIQSLPTFRDLVAHFPGHARFPTPALLNSIGGEVRARLRDGDNTCAIRLSHALNKALGGTVSSTRSTSAGAVFVSSSRLVSWLAIA